MQSRGRRTYWFTKVLDLPYSFSSLDRARAIALGTVVFLALVSSAEAEMDEAVTAFKQVEFQTAFAKIQDLAKDGDPGAQYLLGLLYRRPSRVIRT